ncbi:Transcriptional activator RfaH [Pseudoalteromonas luteoviolacea B = ATCC 29581]|nr:Transcriptional activator RfaH [Pseudoalteromonas luteoviolacea B = ATCC 29581]
MEQWYLLYCKPKQEQRALDNLKVQGIEAFFPTFLHTSLSRGKRTVSEKPLFPNYLFVLLDPEQGPFAKVKNTRGISAFVTYGSQYQVVPNCIVDQIKIVEPEFYQQCDLPKKGDVVFINNRSYKDLQAIYQEADGDKRSILLLKLLNKEVTISVDNQDIQTR